MTVLVVMHAELALPLLIAGLLALARADVREVCPVVHFVLASGAVAVREGAVRGQDLRSHFRSKLRFHRPRVELRRHRLRAGLRRRQILVVIVRLGLLCHSCIRSLGDPSRDSLWPCGHCRRSRCVRINAVRHTRCVRVIIRCRVFSVQRRRTAVRAWFRCWRRIIASRTASKTAADQQRS